MTTDSELISIIANRATKEIRYIRRFFLSGDISFERADETTQTLRRMLWGVLDDLNRNNSIDEADAIGTVLREIKELRDMIYDYKAKVEFYESDLRRELREQFDEESRRG